MQSQTDLPLIKQMYLQIIKTINIIFYTSLYSPQSFPIHPNHHSGILPFYKKNKKTVYKLI